MRNKIILTVLCVLVGLALLTLLLQSLGVDVVGQFNLYKYGEFEGDGYTLTFYGSFGEIRRVKVFRGDEKLVTLKALLSPEILDEDAPAPLTVTDVNLDGKDDIVINAFNDDDGDTHGYLFIGSDDHGFVSAGDFLIANFSFNERFRIVLSEQKEYEHTAETKNEGEIPTYKETTRLTVYTVEDSMLIPYSERFVSYYSETEIYCHGFYSYDRDAGDFVYEEEEWIDIEDYPKEKEYIQGFFTMPIPD